MPVICRLLICLPDIQERWTIRIPRVEVQAPQPVNDQTLKAGLDVNWTLFDGFNISTTYKKLKELERQGETNTRITLEDFIAGLTAEYFNYVQQEIRLKSLPLNFNKLLGFFPFSFSYLKVTLDSYISYLICMKLRYSLGRVFGC